MNLWNTIFTHSKSGRVLSSMVSVGGLSLVVSIAAFVKELVVAHQFGTSDAMDAFLIAFLLPSLAMNILAGAFQAAFIPEYISVREQQGKVQAMQLFSNVLYFYLILLIGFSVLLLLASPLLIPILGSSFNPGKIALSQSLFLILIPILLLTGLIKAWGSLLNAGEHFRLSAISPMITHAAAILVLLGLGGVWGIHALASGIIFGCFLESSVFIYTMRSQGYLFFPRFNAVDDSTRRIVRQYIAMILGSLFMGSTTFVDQAMAAMIGPGSVAALGYGNKGTLFIVGVSSIGLSTVILPHFSKQVAMTDWKAVRQTMLGYSRLIFIVSVPFTLGLIYFSEPIIRLVFERGAFTNTDTQLVGQIQAFYFPQIPFYILGILGVRLLSALGKNQILMIIGAVNLVANVIGNYVFMQYWGLAGIALSTSIVYVLSMFLTFLSLRKQLRNRNNLSEVKDGRKRLP
ncbi:MAG: murein biosynthesis integral membrane protein MurJ [bacterium]